MVLLLISLHLDLVSLRLCVSKYRIAQVGECNMRYQQHYVQGLLKLHPVSNKAIIERVCPRHPNLTFTRAPLPIPSHICSFPFLL